MGDNKMIALSPSASSILALVAENPDVAPERVSQLLEAVEDPRLRDLIGEAVKLIRDEFRHQVAETGGSSYHPENTEAALIASAYLRWARENNRQHSRDAASRQVV
jgi:hypothetical protein